MFVIIVVMVIVGVSVFGVHVVSHILCVCAIHITIVPMMNRVATGFFREASTAIQLSFRQYPLSHVVVIISILISTNVHIVVISTAVTIVIVQVINAISDARVNASHPHMRVVVLTSPPYLHAIVSSNNECSE